MRCPVCSGTMALLASTRALIGGDAPAGREATIDIIRGLCIVSMVFAHVALGGYGHKITHAAVWYDGAMGFVLLSGLVVGMVYRKVVARVGMRGATTKAWKRARLVYLAHLAICVLAFVIAAAFPFRDEVYASVADLGGWWQAVLASLALQINPPQAAILSLYVILLLVTPLACLLMKRRLWWVLVAAIVVVFVAGHAWEELATLPRMPGEFGEINVAAWQAMYFLAFIAGWNWKGVRRALDFPLVWIIAAATTVAIVLCARRTRDGGRPGIVDWAFGSGQMGPGTILLAFAVIVTMFPIIGWLGVRVPLVTGVIARIGRRSLDCYIILAFIVLIAQSVAPYDRSTADVGAILTLVVLWAWARFRDQRSFARAPQKVAVA